GLQAAEGGVEHGREGQGLLLAEAAEDQAGGDELGAAADEAGDGAGQAAGGGQALDLADEAGGVRLVVEVAPPGGADDVPDRDGGVVPAGGGVQRRVLPLVQPVQYG